jgi:tetratricopeptide (TPR) repeat protein
MADIYNNIGIAYQTVGKYAEAIKQYEISSDIYKIFCGQEHTSIALLNGNIGLGYCCLGNYEKAIVYYNSSLKIHLIIDG